LFLQGPALGRCRTEEDSGYGAFPGAKCALKFCANERKRNFTKRPKRKAIANFVHNCGPAVFLMETVEVHPELVRSAHLLIHKAERRLPYGNPGSPGKRKAIEPQPIVDNRSFAQVKRSRGYDMEAKFGGSNSLKIEGVAKETKNLLPPHWQEHRRFKDVGHFSRPPLRIAATPR